MRTRAIRNILPIKNLKTNLEKLSRIKKEKKSFLILLFSKKKNFFLLLLNFCGINIRLPILVKCLNLAKIKAVSWYASFFYNSEITKRKSVFIHESFMETV